MARGITLAEFKRVLRFGLPNGVNWLLEFAAFQVFINVVLGDLGTEAVATFNIVFAINTLSFMPAFGLTSAGAILAGQFIGQGARDQVWPQVKLTLAATAGWMGSVGLLYVVMPGVLLGLFVPAGPQGVRMLELGNAMLLLSAAWQLFDAVALTLSETLRAAGDTTWTAGARLVLAWAVFMPTAYLAVHVGGAGPVAAMGCLAGYVALLAGLLAWRFRGGAWRSIELIEPTLV
ncbi:MAG: MATE family efflux transporter [Kofleriaceae bacterium]